MGPAPTMIARREPSRRKKSPADTLRGLKEGIFASSSLR
jgi:hypothetical protein